MKETFTNFLQSFCSQRLLYLKCCNTIKSIVSQYSSLTVKIKFVLSCAYYKIWRYIVCLQIMIIIYILIFCSSLHNVTNWENFRYMLVYVKQQQYITCQILNQTQKRVFFHTLPWRGDDLNELIHRCDASMRLIKKYRPYPLDQNHQTTTNPNKQF